MLLGSFRLLGHNQSIQHFVAFQAYFGQFSGKTACGTAVRRCASTVPRCVRHRAFVPPAAAGLWMVTGLPPRWTGCGSVASRAPSGLSPAACPQELGQQSLSPGPFTTASNRVTGAIVGGRRLSTPPTAPTTTTTQGSTSARCPRARHRKLDGASSRRRASLDSPDRAPSLADAARPSRPTGSRGPHGIPYEPAAP